ncbi:MAG: hypothetical protein HZB26_08555 [Candidatus Hydrogenedentes bacterium]|nr:hypothetical protein [Candidatus Hydrogenedentota bacterium]
MHNRQLAQGEQVLGHWIVESITIRPASLNLRNEQTGDQIELQLNDSARLPRG